MRRWLQRRVERLRQRIRDRRAHLLERFRAHVNLALAADFRELGDALGALAAAQERRIGELDLMVDALTSEVLRLQQQLDELGPLANARPREAADGRAWHEPAQRPAA